MKRLRKHDGMDFRSLSRDRILIATVLALILIATTAIWGQIATKRKRAQSGDIVAASLQANKPSKEYIYAGGRLVATDEPTAVSNNDAQFISTCVIQLCVDQSATCCPINASSFNIPGEQRLVKVTMKNTGTTTWTPAGGYKLGSQNPANNTTWGTSGAALPAGVSVAPGQQYTFQFNAAKPVNPATGFFNFQWQMFQNGGIGFFGEKTPNGLVAAGYSLPSSTANNEATFVSQSVPSLMFAGKTYTVSIIMNNSGLNTWTSANNYKLSSQTPEDNTTWGLNRVALPASVAPGSNVTFTLNVTAPTTPGTYNFQWMMLQEGGAGWFGALTQPVNVAVNKKATLGYLDFNNDGKTDIAVWRPSNQQWYIDTDLNGTSDISFRFFNANSDRPVPSDYTGNGTADAAMQRTFYPRDWFFDYNLNGGQFDATASPPAGAAVPQDYNGDGRAEVATYNGSGNWYIGTTVVFGASGDIAVPADYNLDGTADLAVFRPSTGTWFIDTDRNGTTDITAGFGTNGDKPLPMDYNGDGIADLAVFRPSTNQWFIDTNRDGFVDLTVTLGASGDVPVPGDYNGDGKADVGVFRPSTGQWLIDTNGDGTADISVTLGASTDIPIRQNGWIPK